MTETIPKTTDRKKELERLIVEAEKQKRGGFLKAVVGITLPLTGAISVTAIPSYTLEGSDLTKLVTFGIGVGIGMSGVVNDYLKYIRNVFSDIKNISERTREYKTELNSII